MSRYGRNVVEHETATKARAAMGNLSEGVAGALNKVKEASEESVKNATPEPLPEGLRDLIFFGRITEDVKFGPYTFTITTLTSKQQRDIFKRLFVLSNEDKIANLKIYTLMEAVKSINGAPPEELYFGGDNGLSAPDKRESVISELQSSVVEVLYRKFEELNKRSNDLIESGGLDESIKN